MLVDTLIMAVVGMIIGWFTNYLAVKLIFRPFKPVKLPLVGFELQGLVPKRRAEIAHSIGETIQQQLLSMEDLLGELITGDNKKAILYDIKTSILEILERKIPALVPKAIRLLILSKIADTLNKELESFMDNMAGDILRKATEQIDISRKVEDKINEFDFMELEAIILNISRKELKHIELLGGVLGFFIGIMQGIIIYLIRLF